VTYDVLDGVRVVELSMYAFAPSCAAVLADWGADVVKVVPPEHADPMLGTPVAALPDVDVGVAFMWEQLNRGKRCIGVDVSTPDGRAVLLRLVAGADVFVTNLLPGARQRFGLEPEDLFAANATLVYGRATGHGDKGPERHLGGYDMTDFWARSGIGHAASQVSDEFVPLAGPALGDLTSGAFLAGGIAAALFRRERTGRGAVVDVSLLSSGTWVLAPGIVASQLYGVDTIPRFPHAQAPNPMVNVYATRDRRLIYISGIQTEADFARFCTAVGRDDLLADPRFATAGGRLAHAAECVAVLDALFAQHDLTEWTALLARMATPWMAVQTAAEAAADVQVAANGYVVGVEGATRRYPLVASPAQFDGAPPRLRPAPGHGEHTDEVLAELGFGTDEVLRLKELGAVL
jgi:crotonobetainyl-CoA:carnitine CoA-transferase CaiB-like acyl-CoA transferase